MKRYDLVDLEQWLKAAFQFCGMDEEDARLSAERLLLADEFGIATHGLARFPTYFRQFLSQGLKSRPKLEVFMDAGVLTIEADRAFGPLVAARAMEAALSTLSPDKAIVPFIIRNAGHLGALATHVWQAAVTGKAALMMQNTQPVMALLGSKGPAIGNNPVAFGSPRPGTAPLIVDFSNSVVALSHVLNARRDDRSIPEGWAIDADGISTTDAAAALQGAMRPAADHKGIALAMVVQTLAGVLSRSQPDEAYTSAAPGTGAFGFVFDPRVIAGESYGALMENWIESYRRATGSGARIPGERIESARNVAASEGVIVDEGLETELLSVGRQMGIPWPMKRGF